MSLMPGSTTAITVTQLARYPAKSCKGELVEAAGVQAWGLAGDRRWMIVDADGCVVTAREHPALLLVTASSAGDGIRFSRPSAPELVVAYPSGGDLVPVEVWGSRLLAAPAGSFAAAWFSEVTGAPVRLVYL